ncbi:unnamed protein product [Spirodela intermedia]|uniref:Uncharacterized protein n=1 Tax=Spirodela intermedia TaxID=51605 RepID=A0A7I8JE61_SPIIN|nr:unnamed protein product [Spirodela intermedia]CAA6668440.1 unnamed protein product [Spirodela intermedia]
MRNQKRAPPHLAATLQDAKISFVRNLSGVSYHSPNMRD